ncbi:MAG: hypothetical protein ACXVII_36045, partial [Solirubrobacteraceae bacterium]
PPQGSTYSAGVDAQGARRSRPGAPASPRAQAADTLPSLRFSSASRPTFMAHGSTLTGTSEHVVNGDIRSVEPSVQALKRLVDEALAP